MSLSLQEISDRMLINDLLIDYATSVDKKDFKLWDKIFVPDAWIDYTCMGGPKGTMNTVRTWLEKTMPTFPMSQHLIGNSKIHIKGDTASARTICYNPMFIPTHNKQYQLAIFGLWYNDQLVRTPDGWRISERIEEHGYSFNVPEGFKPDPSE